MNIEPLKQHWGRIASAFVVLLCLFIFLHYYTSMTFKNYATGRLTDATLNRIALDIPELKLADNRFNQAVNTSKVINYINQLNQYLALQGHPIRTLAIQNTEIKIDEAIQHRFARSLLFPRQTIIVQFALLPSQTNLIIYLVPITLACLLTYLAIPFLIGDKARLNAKSGDLVEEPCKLILDLTTRTLYINRERDVAVPLANKPFCFYLAMLDFCADEQEASLYHNKALPEEFLALTSKYFSRLMDLGHTKRKRPDFNANIDKMLSEIRNALDEVFQTESEAKLKFYPKKAQGEGSRSKLNNFSLSGLSANDYELIGK
ncbi:hypothetical protein [Alteromonas sp. a30]|uniref:hypothetical protein n=1 Tax=Alteromonas sp. a30 TaxID=2730917 RepID=UPI00227F3E53|nr:hypothetical protein [Alteromonas sp. a30]MCY7294470.1 hypothetical protein [Alteromonas sp. a30]